MTSASANFATSAKGSVKYDLIPSRQNKLRFETRQSNSTFLLYLIKLPLSSKFSGDNMYLAKNTKHIVNSFQSFFCTHIF